MKFNNLNIVYITLIFLMQFLFNFGAMKNVFYNIEHAFIKSDTGKKKKKKKRYFNCLFLLCFLLYMFSWKNIPMMTALVDT